MKWDCFRAFFETATGTKPFPYQERLAEQDVWPTMMNIPTGSGKTAASILAWLWKRYYHPDEKVREATPRRLIYCLPMRTLVEQTYEKATGFRENLGINLPIHMFMGGKKERDWLEDVTSEQIIIGTQDLLLSAALNRGFGITRFRWPIAFGLLNNDCGWVFDEIQLMGAGLGTAAQLEAFRKDFKVYGPSFSLWMSATLNPDWLKTIDYKGYILEEMFQLNEKDKAFPVLQKRLNAPKKIYQKEGDISSKKKSDFKKIAGDILTHHKNKEMVLVVANQVEKAQRIFEVLKEEAKGNEAEIILMHSRFRPEERNKIKEKVLGPVPEEGRIVVATQAIEAGVDISARVLFTELAPWASLIQRFGRCNRYGEYSHSQIFWWDVKEKDSAPYSPQELAQSKKILEENEGSSMAPDLLENVPLKLDYKQIIRRKDIVDLFDTSPDLGGMDLDISRFIRENEDLDTHVFWRSWEEANPPSDLKTAGQEELCPVQLWNLKKFLEKGRIAWQWDHLGERWERVESWGVKPGRTYLLHSEVGGYDVELGWNGEKGYVEPVLAKGTGVEEGTSSDPLAFSSRWELLETHSQKVRNEAEGIINKINCLEKKEKECLIKSALWHDAGKAHEVFQETIQTCGNPPPEEGIWAKSPNSNCRHKQPHFRHELASALLILGKGIFEDSERDLIAYLVASHHGKVRLNLRSLPGEKPPKNCPPDTRVVRGVWEGSKVLPHKINSTNIPETEMDLKVSEIGINSDGPSWGERALKLRDKFGPFKLAFLETVIRLADEKASKNKF